MDLSTVTIETERLVLKPITMEYAEVIFREFTDEVTLYMYPKSPEKIEETQEFINKARESMKEGSHLQMVVLDKATGEFLGCAGLHEMRSARPELGIWLKKSAHGQGFGFEAVSGLKKWADENLQCRSLYYPVDERNIPSRRIPEKLGGKIVSRSTEISVSGRTLHIVGYEIPLNAE